MIFQGEKNAWGLLFMKKINAFIYIPYKIYLRYVFLFSYPCCKTEGNRNNFQQNQQQWGLQVKSLRSWPLSSFMCSRIQCHTDLYLLSLSGILKTAPLSWFNVLIYWTSSTYKKGKSRKMWQPASNNHCVCHSMSTISFNPFSQWPPARLLWVTFSTRH